MKLKPSTIFRRTAQMFESREYTGHYACDALGVLAGATDYSGHSTCFMRGSEEWDELREMYERKFKPMGEEMFAPVDAPYAWWGDRDERILSLYFAAAMAATGDL